MNVKARGDRPHLGVVQCFYLDMSGKKKLPFDPEAGKALSSLATSDQETLNALGGRALAEAASKTEPKTLVLSEEERAAQKRFGLQLGPEGSGTEAKN